jgi:hypothetical protein
MPRVGFEPTIPAFEWAKTVHALDDAATVIDYDFINTNYLQSTSVDYDRKTDRIKRGY